MKKKAIWISGIVILILCLMIGIGVMAESSFPFKKWGKTLNDYYQKKEEGLPYAVGKNGMITIEEVKVAKSSYLLQGMDEDEAEKLAADYCMKKEALYQKALREGYSITDQEVWDYVNELRAHVDEAINKDEMREIISQFDSEQDYWNFQFSLCKEELVSKKYVEQLRAVFESENSFDNEEEHDAAWREYHNKLKEEVLKEENFQIVKDK